MYFSQRLIHTYCMVFLFLLSLENNIKITIIQTMQTHISIVNRSVLVCVLRLDYKTSNMRHSDMVSILRDSYKH